MVRRASGYPLLTPAVDLVEIGTGGGSIAWIDNGGQLRVGRRAPVRNLVPPATEKAGTQPTITDADLVLGRINPEYFLGGEMRLDLAAAQRAIDGIAKPLGMSTIQCALGITHIADAAMSQALRVVSVQRGYDPSRFKLVAFAEPGLSMRSRWRKRPASEAFSCRSVGYCFSSWPSRRRLKAMILR